MKKSFCLSVVMILSLQSISIAATLTQMEQLGKSIFTDKNLSAFKNQSCMTCHHPSAKYADPVNLKNPAETPVSLGSDGISYGGRNAPTAAYAGFSPIFTETSGVYHGGLFWDGRATGSELGSPLAEQAKGPFLNPLEMALPDSAAAVTVVANSSYASIFEIIFPETNFSDKSPENVTDIYNNMARAIASFEKSSQIEKFSSTFDDFWAACQTANIDTASIGKTVSISDAPQGILTATQLRGLALFNGKGQCAQCHSSGATTSETGEIVSPLFTEFTYKNIGIPVNPRIAELKNSIQPIDYGLGARSDIASKDPVIAPDGIGGSVTVSYSQAGKFKIPTLRNAAKTAPYAHNGYFADLKSMVHFINTRNDGTWIQPEVNMNIDSASTGSLGLTDSEEKAIVAFLNALTDCAN